MLPENKIVRGMWIGERLTAIQKLCIRSFQDHGHEFHLYAWRDCMGVPPETVMHDIEEITPRPNRTRFTCDSHFSDWFRVNLIHQLGGWYVDMDEVCLRPFDFPEPYVFVSEFPDGLVNGCIFKAPEQSVFLAWIIAEIRGMDTLHPTSWISVGPELFREGVRRFDLTCDVKPPIVFDALRPESLSMFTSACKWDWSASHAAHLRTSYWKQTFDPDGKYPAGSPFEELKGKYGIL